MKRIILALILAVTGAGCANRAAPRGPISGNLLVTFSAMGDVPYTVEEESLLRRQIRSIPRASEFVIHVGDIQARVKEGNCGEEQFRKVAKILSRSPRPLFIIPGDNEYNDCPNPDEAWSFWVKHFMRFDQRWPHHFRIFRQLEREENFAFLHNGVLFIAIHILSGRVHDPQEWKNRHQQDMQWIEQLMRLYKDSASSAVIFAHAFPNPQLHHDCRARISSAARAFAKPVLYLMGDGHRWIHDRPFPAKNILRVQVDMGGIAPPVTVRVTDDPKNPFYFDRRDPPPPPPPATRPATHPATRPATTQSR
jgi:hypothetical protein